MIENRVSELYVEKILAERRLPKLEIIMCLSNKVYEGAHINTEIVFFDNDQPMDLLVSFDGTSIFPITEEIMEAGEVKKSNDFESFIGRLNKYCHMANDEIGLFATRMDVYNWDKYAIVGIGKLENNLKCAARLKLKGHLNWSLSYIDSNDDKKSIYYNGLFLESLSQKNDIPEEFDAASTEIITKIVNCAKKQKHGTMLVVLEAEQASLEARRLCEELGRGFLVNTFQLTESLLDSIIVPITSIDGAILIDNAGFCYGLGVILDGKATTPANSARGARFNSACVYVNNMKQEGKKCLCIVISEDGMVNHIGTQNVENYSPERINYNKLCEENHVYHMNCMYDAYCDGKLEWEEARHSRLHGDPDSF